MLWILRSLRTVDALEENEQGLESFLESDVRVIAYRRHIGGGTYRVDG